MSLGLPQGHAK